jgi:hypothetical protein
MLPQPNVTCPLCGERNDCAPARSGSLDTSCWCTEVVVDPAALARLPESERNKVCLCRRCATSGATS